MNDQDKKWSTRYYLMMACRIGGLLIALAGLAIAKGGVLLDTAYPLLGSALILVGLLDSTLAPRLLNRHFARQDAA